MPLPHFLRDPALRLGLLLWAIGMPGIVGIAIFMLPQLLQESRGLPPLPVLVFASVAQSAVLLALAVWAGTRLAPQTGLAAPVLKAVAASEPVLPPLKKAFLPGVLAGVAGGALLFLLVATAPAEFAAAQARIDLPLMWRVLYGGITEEVLIRWGLMTLLAWLGWRFLQGGTGVPAARCMWIAIIVSALLFGVAHLPAIAAQAGSLATSLTAYVVLANAVLGVLFGYLFWRFGLEAAIIAHASAHVVAHLAGSI